MVLHQVLRNAAFTPKCLYSPFLVPGRYKHLTGYYCRVTPTLQDRHTKSVLAVWWIPNDALCGEAAQLVQSGLLMGT